MVSIFHFNLKWNQLSFKICDTTVFLLWYLYSLLNPPRARYLQNWTTENLCRKRRPYHKGKTSYGIFTLILKQIHVYTCKCPIHNFEVWYSQPFQPLTLNYLQRSTTVDYIHSLFLKILFSTSHNLTIATSHDLVSCPTR